VVFHYEEALYRVYAPFTLSLPLLSAVLVSCISFVVFQRHAPANEAHNAAELRSSPLSHSDTPRASATTRRWFPAHHFSQLVEEAPAAANSVTSDSPPLPPKTAKSSSSILLDGDKSNHPPEIPLRRLSTPHSGGHLSAETAHADDDGSKLSVTMAPEQSSPARQQPQKQSPVNVAGGTSDVEAPPLRKRPASYVNCGIKVLPEPHGNRAVRGAQSGEASGPQSSVQHQVPPPAGHRSGAERPADRPSSEPMVKPPIPRKPRGTVVSVPFDLSEGGGGSLRNRLSPAECQPDAATASERISPEVKPRTATKPTVNPTGVPLDSGESNRPDSFLQNRVSSVRSHPADGISPKAEVKPAAMSPLAADANDNKLCGRPPQYAPAPCDIDL